MIKVWPCPWQMLLSKYNVTKAFLHENILRTKQSSKSNLLIENKNKMHKQVKKKRFRNSEQSLLFCHFISLLKLKNCTYDHIHQHCNSYRIFFFLHYISRKCNLLEKWVHSWNITVILLFLTWICCYSLALWRLVNDLSVYNAAMAIKKVLRINAITF